MVFVKWGKNKVGGSCPQTTRGSVPGSGGSLIEQSFKSALIVLMHRKQR